MSITMYTGLNREGVNEVDKALVERLWLVGYLGECDQHYPAILLGYQRRRTLLDKRHGGCGAHPARCHPVASGWRTAALDMTQHHHPRLHPDLLRHRVGDCYRASRTRSFRDNDYRRALAANLAVLDPATPAIDIKRTFLYHHASPPASHTTPQPH